MTMATRRFILFLLFACTLSAALVGCFGTSPATRFYTLCPPEGGHAPETAVMNAAVEIGPITIPDYLNRTQIVTRSGRNELVLAEFDRWGGSLDEEISRALAADLTARLSSLRIAVLPWRSPLLATARTVYRISVAIDRFDGAPGATVVLNATWGMFVREEKHERSVLAQQSTVTEEVRGTGYGEMVAAMGKAVEGLGKEMANRVAEVAARQAEKSTLGGTP